MFTRILLLVCAIALSACEGATGAMGPAGPSGPDGGSGPAGPAGTDGGGYYSSRANVYCNTVTNTAGLAVVTAPCNTLTDIPIGGGCSSSPTVTTVALVTSQPVAWEAAYVDQVPAYWACAWVSNGAGTSTDGTPVILTGASAKICCVQVP